MGKLTHAKHYETAYVKTQELPYTVWNLFPVKINERMEPKCTRSNLEPRSLPYCVFFHFEAHGFNKKKSGTVSKYFVPRREQRMVLCRTLCDAFSFSKISSKRDTFGQKN